MFTFATTALSSLVRVAADQHGATISTTTEDVPAGYVTLFRVLNGEDAAFRLVASLAHHGARIAPHRAPRTLTSDETARRVTRDPFTFG